MGKIYLWALLLLLLLWVEKDAVLSVAQYRDHPGSLGLNYSEYSKVHFSSSHLRLRQAAKTAGGRVNLTVDKDDLSASIFSPRFCCSCRLSCLPSSRIIEPKEDEEVNKQRFSDDSPHPSDPMFLLLLLLLPPLLSRNSSYATVYFNGKWLITG